jgi:hypothetical protein
MFGKSPFKELKKELADLYEREQELEDVENPSQADKQQLDKILADIDRLIEGRYSEAVFDYYSSRKPKLVRSHTGEIMSWDEAFGTTYGGVSKSLRHSLVGLVEGGGRYKIK